MIKNHTLISVIFKYRHGHLSLKEMQGLWPPEDRRKGFLGSTTHHRGSHIAPPATWPPTVAGMLGLGLNPLQRCRPVAFAAVLCSSVAQSQQSVETGTTAAPGLLRKACRVLSIVEAGTGSTCCATAMCDGPKLSRPVTLLFLFLPPMLVTPSTGWATVSPVRVITIVNSSLHLRA